MILLLLYTVYVIFMYYNPRCDAFWNAWCRQHPTCCPRAIHTEQEELDYMQQHSGAFGHVTGQTQTPGFPSALPPEQGYTRLSSDKMNDPYLSTGGKFFISVFLNVFGWCLMQTFGFALVHIFAYIGVRFSSVKCGGNLTKK